jgi:hypothetical protein
MRAKTNNVTTINMMLDEIWPTSRLSLPGDFFAPPFSLFLIPEPTLARDKSDTPPLGDPSGIDD